MKLLNLLVLVIIVGCSTNSTNKALSESDEVAFVEKVEASCIPTALVSSTAFSILPPVAKIFAKEMLVTKAKEARSNRLILTSEEGLFHVSLNAKAFRCAETKETKKKGN